MLDFLFILCVLCIRCYNKYRIFHEKWHTKILLTHRQPECNPYRLRYLTET